MRASLQVFRHQYSDLDQLFLQLKAAFVSIVTTNLQRSKLLGQWKKDRLAEQ
jgi:hypothetical protein